MNVGSIKFEIPGIPVAKGRPRFGRGRAYTPRKTRNAENRIADAALKAMGRNPPMIGPLWIQIVFGFPVPKSFSKARRVSALAGGLNPTSKPDIDNLVKAIMDGLNGIAYFDDSQIVDIAARKWFMADPTTIVMVGQR